LHQKRDSEQGISESFVKDWMLRECGEETKKKAELNGPRRTVKSGVVTDDLPQVEGILRGHLLGLDKLSPDRGVEGKGRRINSVWSIRAAKGTNTTEGKDCPLKFGQQKRWGGKTV